MCEREDGAHRGRGNVGPIFVGPVRVPSLSYTTFSRIAALHPALSHLSSLNTIFFFF